MRHIGRSCHGWLVIILALLSITGCLEKSESEGFASEPIGSPGPAPTPPAPTPPAPTPPAPGTPPPADELQAVISATPTAGAAALTVDVTGVQSTSPGLITSYSWDFDDGTIIEGASTSHIYALAGSYDVTLTVRDDQGGVHATSTSISVFDANARILYVNNSGSPACSDSTSYQENSPSRPWCSLLRAVRGNSDGNRNSAGVPAQAAQAGDMVLVSAGTYDYDGPAYEPGHWLGVFYDPINSGRPEAWVEFRADGVVTLTGNRSGRASMIGSNQAQYIKWTGFTLNQALSSYRNGIATASVDNIWFEGNTIIGEHTVYSHAGDNHPGLIIHGPRGNGCEGGISNITVRNNSISGFTGGSGRNDSGITLYCLGENILIENNDIFDNETGIYAKSNYRNNRNIVVRKNRFFNNLGDAIAMGPYSDWNVYQNIMENNQSGFLFFNTIYFVGEPKSNHVYVANNTMVGNRRSGIYFKWMCENMSDNHVVNNLIIGSNAVSTDDVTCTTPENVGVDDVRFDWNFYGISGEFYQDFVASFATWQSSFGQDADSIYNIDPLFTDAAAGDFRLQPTSSARDAGRDVLDLDGDGDTTDSINAGAFVTGTEVIGAR